MLKRTALPLALLAAATSANDKQNLRALSNANANDNAQFDFGGAGMKKQVHDIHPSTGRSNNAGGAAAGALHAVENGESAPANSGAVIGAAGVQAGIFYHNGPIMVRRAAKSNERFAMGWCGGFAGVGAFLLDVRNSAGGTWFSPSFGAGLQRAALFCRRNNLNTNNIFIYL